MKNKVQSLFVLVAILMLNLASAQSFQGVAIYVSHKQLDLKLDSIKYDLDTRKKVQGIFAKQFQKTYKLSFTTMESNYIEQKKMI